VKVCPTSRKSALTESFLKTLFQSFGRESPHNSSEVVLKSEDIHRLMSSMGVVLSDKTLGEVMEKADLNGDGVICFEEFKSAYQWLMSQQPTKEDLREIFSILDLDDNGTIELEELTGALNTTKESITQAEAEKIFALCNALPHESITFEQFCSVIHQHKFLMWRLLTSFRLFFVVGGPASGKGTICSSLNTKVPNVVHVSSGDLLRHEVESNSPLGKQLADTMKRGDLVDASIVLALLDKLLCEQRGKVVLLDGFPRSLENAVDFVKLFGKGEGCLVFQCPEDVMENRIVERGKTSGRSDDTRETARRRIATFKAQSVEAVQYFRTIGMTMYELDTTKPLDENVEKLLQLPAIRVKTK